MTLSCPQTLERLSGLVDGALDAADRSAVQEHLAACAACRREAEAISEVRRLLLGVGVERAPGELRGLVASRVKEEARTGGARPASRWSHLSGLGWMRAAALLVAVVAGTAIVVRELPYLGRSRSEEPEARPAETAALPENRAAAAREQLAVMHVRTVDPGRTAYRRNVSDGFAAQARDVALGSGR